MIILPPGSRVKITRPGRTKLKPTQMSLRNLRPDFKEVSFTKRSFQMITITHRATHNLNTWIIVKAILRKVQKAGLGISIETICQMKANKRLPLSVDKI
jgi:hypothetical protein